MSALVWVYYTPLSRIKLWTTTKPYPLPQKNEVTGTKGSEMAVQVEGSPSSRAMPQAPWGSRWKGVRPQSRVLLIPSGILIFLLHSFTLFLYPSSSLRESPSPVKGHLKPSAISALVIPSIYNIIQAISFCWSSPSADTLQSTRDTLI